jgi:hypothetical protein
MGREKQKMCINDETKVCQMNCGAYPPCFQCKPPVLTANQREFYKEIRQEIRRS